MSANEVYAVWLGLYAILFAGRLLALRASQTKEDQPTEVALGWAEKSTWTVALGTVVVAWLAGSPPEESVKLLVVLLFASVPVAWLLRLISGWLRRIDPFASRTVRLWLAGSFVWVIAIMCYALVFGRLSRLRHVEMWLLAFLPPLVSAIAVVAWRWANKRK